MGQSVSVIRKPSAVGGVLRFEINRSLTGMGHEYYRDLEAASGPRPPDELARRLFALGGIESVHINSNVITVDLVKGESDSGMAEIIEDLFLHWRPGMVPPTDEEVIAAASK